MTNFPFYKLMECLSFQVRNIAKELVDVFDLPRTWAPMLTAEAYSQYTQYVGFYVLEKDVGTTDWLKQKQGKIHMCGHQH